MELTLGKGVDCFYRQYLELGTWFRKRRLEMGAECFTKGLPLQAKQRQPSPALAFSPNGHYGVKFCVFCMISIYLDLSILFILRKIFLLRIVVSEKIL